MPRNKTLLFLFILIGLALLSVAARLDVILKRPLAGRFMGEAESHVLVTCQAFQQMPWQVHHFLPVFTLGPAINKHIDQHPGAASPDQQGNYYYTSTPPLTFVLPYLGTLACGGPSIVSLRIVALATQFLAAGALAFLVLGLARMSNAEENTARLAACVTALFYMCAPEALRSHAFMMWGQHFYAIILPLQIYFAIVRPRPILCGALAFLGALTDWTAYVASAGMALLPLFTSKASLRTSLCLLVGTGLGGVTMLAWFSSVFPISQYLANLSGRSASRAGGAKDLIKLAPEYINSLGLFLVPLLLALLAAPWRDAIAQWRRRLLPPFAVACLVLLMALAENLLMRGHAITYSFDRLKGVQFAALLAAWVIVARPTFPRALVASAVVAGFGSLAYFWICYSTPGGWGYVREATPERVGKAIGQWSAPAGPSFYNSEIRGSEVFYAGRNVFEYVDSAAAAAKMDTVSFIRDWCARHGFPGATLFEISNTSLFPTAAEMPRKIRVRWITPSGIDEVAEVTLPEQYGEYSIMFRNSRILELEPLFRLKESR